MDYKDFFIDQGEQVEDGIIEEKNVLVKIKNLKASSVNPKTEMIVIMEILDSEHKGRTHSEFITYDPDSPKSFKYRKLRTSIGKPYMRGESKSINIGQMLIGQILRVDFSKYSKDGKDYQNIDFLAPLNTEEKATGLTAAGVVNKRAEDLPENYSNESILDDVEEDIEQLTALSESEIKNW
jgi:hypothetical protein